ncbi:MAG: hypothetical protein QXF07_01450 [Candidatus Micrarchaeia archaeon]
MKTELIFNTSKKNGKGDSYKLQVPRSNELSGLLFPSIEKYELNSLVR